MPPINHETFVQAVAAVRGQELRAVLEEVLDAKPNDIRSTIDSTAQDLLESQAQPSLRDNPREMTAMGLAYGFAIGVHAQRAAAGDELA